jgi:hypothetical protein
MHDFGRAFFLWLGLLVGLQGFCARDGSGSPECFGVREHEKVRGL